MTPFVVKLFTTDMKFNYINTFLEDTSIVVAKQRYVSHLARQLNDRLQQPPSVTFYNVRKDNSQPSGTFELATGQT